MGKVIHRIGRCPGCGSWFYSIAFNDPCPHYCTECDAKLIIPSDIKDKLSPREYRMFMTTLEYMDYVIHKCTSRPDPKKCVRPSGQPRREEY